jgi:Na+/H+-translocating membrane pyrophosphatase
MMTTAMQLAIDALDHINAGGIAEMSELQKKCVHVLISDSVGIRLQQLKRFYIASAA